MAELETLLRIVETLSTLMAESYEHVQKTDVRAPAGSDAAKGLTTVKDQVGAKDRQARDQRRNVAEEIAGVAYEDKLHATPLPDWIPGMSKTDLKTMLASQTVLSGAVAARMARGLTPVEYARYAALCFGLIREASDYAQSILRSQLDLVRSHQMETLMHSDLRPTAASLTSATAAPTTVYDGVEHDDGVRQALLESALFADNASFMRTPLTPYETPVVSGPVTPAASGPASPTDDDDAADVNLMDF